MIYLSPSILFLTLHMTQIERIRSIDKENPGISPKLHGEVQDYLNRGLTLVERYFASPIALN